MTDTNDKRKKSIVNNLKQFRKMSVEDRLVHRNNMREMIEMPGIFKAVAGIKDADIEEARVLIDEINRMNEIDLQRRARSQANKRKPSLNLK